MELAEFAAWARRPAENVVVLADEAARLSGAPGIIVGESTPACARLQVLCIVNQRSGSCAQVAGSNREAAQGARSERGGAREASSEGPSRRRGSTR
jgi:hypothetical protein